jgi:hypothetical protein
MRKLLTLWIALAMASLRSAALHPRKEAWGPGQGRCTRRAAAKQPF